MEGEDKSTSGTIKIQETSRDFILVSEKKSPFFFKVGLHSQIRFLNSSFFNLEVGQFFTLGANKQYQLMIEDSPTRTISRNWEGLTWSVGAVLPLRVFDEKLRKKGE